MQLGGAGPVPGMQWGCHLFCGADRAFWTMGMAAASVSAGVCASTRITQQGLSFIFRQLIHALPFILKHQSNRHPKICFTWLFDSQVQMAFGFPSPCKAVLLLAEEVSTWIIFKKKKFLRA